MDNKNGLYNAMKIEVFLDGIGKPIATLDAPEKFNLDTTQLEDGAHILQFRATQESGITSSREIPITVRNGPAIAVHGIRENEIVHDQITILANAYTSEIGDTFEPERIETPRPIPTWAWLNVLIVFAWGMWYLGVEYQEHQAESRAQAVQTGSQGPKESESWSLLGEQIYGNTCSACHGSSGDGLPGVFPPLKDNQVVLEEDPTEHIQTIVNGLQGKTINGVSYGSPMPAFGTQLSVDEIVAVVNHERTNWGNNASTVSNEQVVQIMSGSDTPSGLQPDKPAVTPAVTEAATAVASADQSSAEDWQELGAQVYGNYCASCHQPAGGGLPGVFPALASNAVVVASDPAEHIGTVLNGLIGKTIDGIAYTAPMPGFAAQLTNEEIVAVINHERTNWGNSAPLVTVDMVNQFR